MRLAAARAGRGYPFYALRFCRRTSRSPTNPAPSSASVAGSDTGCDDVENVFSTTEETERLPGVRATFAKSLDTERLLTPVKVMVSVALPGFDACNVFPFESVSSNTTVPPLMPLPVSNRLASMIGAVDVTSYSQEMSAVDGGGDSAAAEKVSARPSDSAVILIGPTTPSPVVLGLMLMELNFSVPTVQENPGAV